MKQKSPGTTSRIEHALFQWAVHRVPDHFRREPVGGVVLAKLEALVAIDQQLIEYFENVPFDLGQPKAADMVHDPPHQRLAFNIGHRPIEEVALDRAGDAS